MEKVSPSGYDCEMADRRSLAPIAYEAELLDDVNRRIVEELRADARLSMAELGRRISLSAPAVAERVQRLERAGVITGYHAAVDPKAIGYPLAAVVRIRPASRQLHRIPEVAQEIPEVVECSRITGEDCFIVRLHLRAMEDLEPILDSFAVHGQTTTSIVHSTPVAPRALPIPESVVPPREARWR
jgi:Lrp/AsnC family leucine-responsive transcriptional regulator